MAQKIKKSVTVQIKKFHNLWQKLSSVYVLRPTASCNKYIEAKFSALLHISIARSKQNRSTIFTPDGVAIFELQRAAGIAGAREYNYKAFKLPVSIEISYFPAPLLMCSR
jgi:hypothetical protein